MKCPIDKPMDDCPCKDFSKEGICDYPYKMGMSEEEIKAVTFVLEHPPLATA